MSVSPSGAISSPEELLFEIKRAGDLQLSGPEIEELFAAFFDQLQLQVGESLSSGMSDAKLEEFEKLIDSNDEDGATAFLNREVPGYRALVFIEVHALLARTVRELLDAGIIR